MSGRRGDDSVGPAGDEPHDGHLKEALRHAPDATLAAPPALSAAILQQASAAVHAPAQRGVVGVPPPRWLTLLRNVWDGLTRPPVAASLAGLMVATSLTLLWRDGLMEQPFDGPAPAESVRLSGPPPSATPPATPVAAQTPAPAPPPKPEPAALAKYAGLPERSAAATRAPTPPTAAPGANEPVPPDAPVMADRAEAPPALRPAPVPAPGANHAPAAPAPAPVPAWRSPSMPAPPPAPETTPSPAPGAAATRPPPVVAATPPQEARDALPVATPIARSATEATRGRLDPRSFAADSSAPPELPGRLAGLMAELRAEPARWTMQADGAVPRPIDGAATAWLQALVREAEAAGAHWLPPSAPSFEGPAASSEPTGTTTSAPAVLQLWRDGLARHRFQLGDDQVGWQTTGRSVVLVLPTAALRRLAQAFPR